MELTGQQTLSLPIDAVWSALNDPAILQQCIPGCDTFEAAGQDRYNIAMTATVGPIKARFTGKLALSDIMPPHSYRLQFDGSGGAAGSGKGTAHVQLSEDPEGTALRYTVGATVSGRLAQVGARLIDGVAKKMADQFFARFKAILEPSIDASAGEADVGEAGASEARAEKAGSAQAETRMAASGGAASGAGRTRPAPAASSSSNGPSAPSSGTKWAAAVVVVLAIALGVYAFST